MSASDDPLSTALIADRTVDIATADEHQMDHAREMYSLVSSTRQLAIRQGPMAQHGAVWDADPLYLPTGDVATYDGDRRPAGVQVHVGAPGLYYVVHGSDNAIELQRVQHQSPPGAPLWSEPAPQHWMAGTLGLNHRTVLMCTAPDSDLGSDWLSPSPAGEPSCEGTQLAFAQLVASTNIKLVLSWWATAPPLPLPEGTASPLGEFTLLEGDRTLQVASYDDHLQRLDLPSSPAGYRLRLYRHMSPGEPGDAFVNEIYDARLWNA